MHARPSSYRRWSCRFPTIASTPYRLGATNKVRPTGSAAPGKPHHYSAPRDYFLSHPLYDAKGEDTTDTPLPVDPNPSA